VVVHDLDIEYMADLKSKANTPLVVDADAELTTAVAFERFEPVVRGCSQVV
jgi:hypothetical protein